MEALRRQAEAEMRRPAPDSLQNKRLKISGHGGDVATGAATEVKRFDYSAARSLSGQAFVVHCQFRRELSATREATAVLLQCLQNVSPKNLPCARTSCPVEACHNLAAAPEGQQQQPSSSAKVLSTVATFEDVGKIAKQQQQQQQQVSCADQADSETSPSSAQSTGFSLTPLKLSCSGLVLLLLHGAESGSATAAIANLLDNLQQEKVPLLKHCKSITPVEQLISSPTSELLRSAAKSIASAWLARQSDVLSKLEDIRYAVAYKPRNAALQGRLESETPATMAVPAPSSTDIHPAADMTHPECDPGSHTAAQAPRQVSLPQSLPSAESPVLTRGRAIAALAAGAADAAAASHVSAAVDLSQPKWLVVSEGLPIKSVLGGLVVTVAVVPAGFMRLKPKFCMISTSAPAV